MALFLQGDSVPIASRLLSVSGCICLLLSECVYPVSHYNSVVVQICIFRIDDVVLNIDLAPTFLDIAGVEIPDHMDGKSIFPILGDAFAATA